MTKSPLTQLRELLNMDECSFQECHGSDVLPPVFADPVLLMSGDNFHGLQVLRHQQQCFDLCYIDPPYNTGSAFVYQDKRRSLLHGIFGQHEPWMRFMLPRLWLGRELLAEHGIFAVSIDDHAMTAMQTMLDAVFGAEHRLGTIVVCRSKNGRGAKGSLATCHEYLLLYRKTHLGGLRGFPDQMDYPKSDAHGQFRIDGLLRKKGDASLRTDRPNLYYPLYVNRKTNAVSLQPGPGLVEVWPRDSAGVERRWIWSASRAEKELHRLFGSESGVIYLKSYAKPQSRQKARTWWDSPQFYTERGTNEITKIFGQKVFDTPKPLAFIRQIIDMCGGEDLRVLDFFAGSGTTAVALAQLNQEDGGRRQCVLVESAEPVPEMSIAARHGFCRLSEITAARLSRAGVDAEILELSER